MISLEKLILASEDVEDKEPSPDIAICSTCGWRGNVSECEIDKDGDWESGYYDIHLCPKCEDGGCVGDYVMSAERAKEWDEWNERNEES